MSPETVSHGANEQRCRHERSGSHVTERYQNAIFGRDEIFCGGTACTLHRGIVLDELFDRSVIYGNPLKILKHDLVIPGLCEEIALQACTRRKSASTWQAC